jgi:hypothetical protein
MSNKLIQSMLEPLASRFQSIEDRLSNLESKKESSKEITDTERLDFFENKQFDCMFFSTFNIWHVKPQGNGYFYEGGTVREAIDKAIKGEE